jgi:hypothetical protein
MNRAKSVFLWRGGSLGKLPEGKGHAEMASKKVVVPLVGTNVKKGVNYVKDAEGNPVKVEEKGAGRGRPPKHDVAAVVTKSIEIIQTLRANKREMYMVAVAYFDNDFDVGNERERVRLQNICREIEQKTRNSKQENYKGLLDRCKLKYQWLVDAARSKTPLGHLLSLAYAMSQEEDEGTD